MRAHDGFPVGARVMVRRWKQDDVWVPAVVVAPVERRKLNVQREGRVYSAYAHLVQLEGDPSGKVWGAVLSNMKPFPRF